MATVLEFPKYLNVKQVSDILGVSPKWVYKNKEKIPGYFRLAGIILFDSEIFFKELKRLANGKFH